MQTGLRSGSYRFTPYREILASKGSGRAPRVISIPTVRDRLALKTLSHILHDLYGFSGPEVAQRLVGRVGACCDSATGYVRIDLKDYFGSINHDILLDRLKGKVRSRALQRGIIDAVQNPTVPSGVRSDRIRTTVGIPQGLSISSALAEIYLVDLDQQWQANPLVQYFRYVDDIVLLCKAEDCASIFDQAQSQLRARKLTAHPVGAGSKSAYGSMDDGFDFLGYHFGAKGTSISEAGMRKIENRIAATFGEYRRKVQSSPRGRLAWLDWKISRLTCGVIFEGEHRGWLKFYSRTTNISGLHHLDALVSKLARKSGVPITLRLKKFVKAYYVTKSGHAFNDYIPNPARWGAAAMREHLIEVHGWEQPKVAALSKLELSLALDRVLTRDLGDLERDLDIRS